LTRRRCRRRCRHQPPAHPAIRLHICQRTQLEDAAGEPDEEARSLLEQLASTAGRATAAAAAVQALPPAAAGPREHADIANHLASLEAQLGALEAALSGSDEGAREILGAGAAVWIGGGGGAAGGGSGGR